MEIGSGNKIFAYMRISTQKEAQKTDRQRYTLEKYAEANSFTVDAWFEERVSGKTKPSARKEYSRLKAQLRTGDVVLFCDLDRVARNEQFILEELQDLKNKGIIFVILDVPGLNDWNSSTRNDSMSEFIQDMVLRFMSFFAQRERERIQQRVQQGVDTAKAKGKKLGRPATGVPAKFRKFYEAYLAGKYGEASVGQLSRMYGIAEGTFYKYQKLLREEKESKSESK